MSCAVGIIYSAFAILLFAYGSRWGLLSLTGP